MRRCILLTLALLGCAVTNPFLKFSHAADHPVVPGFERFYTQEKADLQKGGQLLITELGCVNCHQSELAISKRPAPILDKVGSRVRISYLRKFLNDPHKVKPGSLMPHLLEGDPDREEKVEALVHFLATTGELNEEPPRRQSISVGKNLYHRLGCVACHGTRNNSGQPDVVLASSVPLGDLSQKYSITGLRTFLINPHQVRPSGRMPKLLNPNEARDVANYLMQGAKFDLAKEKGATKYSYYHGDWGKLPDFDKLKPVATGHTVGIDLGVAQRGDFFGIKFEGFIDIKNAGKYSFTLVSDDGSRLLIDGKTVVDNDGVHAPQAKGGSINLEKGTHSVTILFFEKSGGAELRARIRGEILGERNLGDLIAPTKEALAKKKPKKPTDDPDFIEIDPTLVAKGQKLFTSMGCANCHQLSKGGKQIASTLKAPGLDKLDVSAGCLSPKVKPGVPSFHFSEKQVQALSMAVKKPVAPPTEPKAVIAQTLTSFNCYACHARDTIGGPEDELNKLFATNEPEMGDEARIPPPLNGVGAKLKADYFAKILDQGANDRPYMYTRMPGFGQKHVGHLVGAFEKVDSLPDVGKVNFKEKLGQVRAAGRHLVGQKAFQCYKCHTFRGQKAEGTQGIDMVLMPKRLKRDWFHAYVANPQEIRPGTRMPTGFIKGKSLLPKVLDGTAHQQIEAMWAYLSRGTRAQFPLGMSRGGIPLTPVDSAIIYRNFIQGAGPRAIAVGYPESAHLAFDANEMRIAMIWQGEFIDARRHWTGRGQGFEGPLGDNVMSLPGGPGFAVLENKNLVWPNKSPKDQGYRFRGYRLTPDDRPTFLYSMPGVTIEDFPNAKAGATPMIERTLTLKTDNGVTNLYFRAAVGSSIEKDDKGDYLINGQWRMRLKTDAEPIIRKQGNNVELIVPVQFQKGTAKIVQTYIW